MRIVARERDGGKVRGEGADGRIWTTHLAIEEGINMADTTTSWQNFEEEIFQNLQSWVDEGNLSLDPKYAKVFKKKGYYSKDREKSIIFDASIEVFVQSHEVPWLIWLWECKNYPNRKVKVDEVEEFYAKMGQIGSVKGTMVTLLGYDDGAIVFAKSKKIGLAVVNKRIITYLCLSRDAEDGTYEVIDAVDGVFSDGEEYGEDSRRPLRGFISREMVLASVTNKFINMMN